MLDTIGERYGLLPSEVMRRANTFDMFIVQTAINYRNLLQDRVNAGGKPHERRPDEYTEDDLLKILKETNG